MSPVVVDDLCSSDTSVRDLAIVADTSGVGRCDGVSGGAVFTRDRPLGVGYKDRRSNDPTLPDHVAYLTFDDGPSEWTRTCLAALSAHDARATFFVNARNFKGALGLDGTYVDDQAETVSFGDVIKDIVTAGHAIGNHTADHFDLATLDGDAARAQLDDNERLINVALTQRGLASRPIGLLRPPWGSPWYRGDAPVPDLEAAQLSVGELVELRGFNVFWNLDSGDWREWAEGESYTKQPDHLIRDMTLSYADKVSRTKQTVLESSLVRSGRGALILFHDTHSTTRDALPDILEGLVAKGYAFATVEDLVQQRFGRSSVELTPGPALYDVCAVSDVQSCERFETGRAVCGRMWRAFTALGGRTALGQPVNDLQHGRADRPVSQAFERGTIELHPEAGAACATTLPAQ